MNHLLLLLVCTDNMIYMDLCVQWKEMCQQSKFLQDKCPRTCGTCAPGRSKINHIDLYLNASKTLCFDQ